MFSYAIMTNSRTVCSFVSPCATSLADRRILSDIDTLLASCRSFIPLSLERTIHSSIIVVSGKYREQLSIHVRSSGFKIPYESSRSISSRKSLTTNRTRKLHFHDVTVYGFINGDIVPRFTSMRIARIVVHNERSKRYTFLWKSVRTFSQSTV